MQYYSSEQPHILFIDDGINSGVFDLNLVYNLKYDYINRNIVQRKDNEFDITHGTICAAIVKKYYQDFLCSSLKILDKSSRTCNVESLRYSLIWCIDKCFDIIHMSIGSSNFRDYYIMKDVINKLARDKIIVCALANDMSRAYPCSFSSVVGVKKVSLNCDINSYYNASIDGADISVKAVHKLITKNGRIVRTGNFNSFAAPFITAEICKHFSFATTHSNEEIKSFFLRKYNKSSSRIIYILPDWIENCVVFSSIKINQDLVKFNIKCIFTLQSIVYKYKHIRNKKDIDSIIIVFDGEISPLHKQNIINCAISSNKNITIIDLSDDAILNIQMVKLKIWYSKDWENEIYYQNDTNNPMVPIIAIFDSDIHRLASTSVSLKNKFQDDGYNATTVSNSPFLVLYDAIYVPFKKEKTLQYLGTIENNFRTDIIIYCVHIKNPCFIYNMVNILSPDINILFEDKQNFLDKNENIIYPLEIFDQKSSCVFYSELYHYVVNFFKRITLP